MSLLVVDRDEQTKDRKFTADGSCRSVAEKDYTVANLNCASYELLFVGVTWHSAGHSSFNAHRKRFVTVDDDHIN